MTTLYLCHSSEFGALEDTAGLCSSSGYGIELSDFSDTALLENKEKVQAISESIKGITGRALHAPYLEMNPVSSNSEICTKTLKCYEEAYAAAVRLLINHIILHSIYDPSTHSYQEWFEQSVCFWKEYLNGKSGDIRFHLENVMDASPEILLALIDEIDRPNLDINFDIGHAYVYSKVAVSDWIRILGRKIGYVHLHDNHGKVDEHIGLGQGSIPLDEACQLLLEYAPEAVWAVESGGIGTVQSISWLSRHGFIG